MNAHPTPAAADHLLRDQCRWLRSAWPLAIAAAGLAVTLAAGWWLHPSWARVEKWGALPAWWACGVGATLTSSAAVWLFRRRSLLHSAQRLDDRLAAKNRVETATMLRNASDAIARAQREETAEFLDHAPMRARGTPLRWLTALVVLLALSHFVTLVSWTRPWARPAFAEKKAATPAPAPTATIKWKSPKPEIKAAPIEEVPLEATADSSSGLRELILEIEVNGEPKLSAPVPVAGLEKSGPHKIETSLFLDLLEVEPYDMVSYYLRAQRITDRRDLPETASPMQFVQVKPLRDDIREGAGPGGAAGETLLGLIKALKVAQLRLMKENFLLLHAEIPRENPEWQKENKRVGGEQGVLETKTGEVIQKMISLGAAAEMVDLISEAKPLIGDAAKKILAIQNQQAVPPQGKALSLITAVEKFFVKAIVKTPGGKPKPQVADPFEKQRDVELKQRFATKAGELELLAREQARLAEDLAHSAPAMPAPESDAKPDKNRITGSAPERQTQVSQRTGALLNGNVFGPETTGHLDKAREQARESLRHLDAEDAAAACEPAAVTARELRLAQEAMQRAAEEQAKEQMDAALRDLNNAADTARNAPDEQSDEKAREAAQKAAEQAGQTRRDLAEAAQKQQETGSEQAAKRMAELANALNDPKLREALRKLREQPRDRSQAEATAQQISKIAQNAAQQPSGDAAKKSDDLANLVSRMERARANLQRLAGQEARQGKNGEGQPPNGKSQSPSGKSQSPNGKSQSPSGEGQSPNGEGQSPSGEGQSPSGEGQSPSGESQSPNGNQGKNQMPGRGAGEGSGQGEGQGSGAGGSPPTARARFARELLEDLRDFTDEGARFLPNAQTQLDELRTTLQQALNYHQRPAAKPLDYYTAIEKPLGNVIDLLRAELHSSRRQHEIRDQHAEKAPPAYRAAVDDYFERLSRDYEKEKNEE